MSIARVAVLGGGQMGTGIAQAIAAGGFDVALIKATPGLADQPKAGIQSNLDRSVAQGRLAEEEAERILARITFTDDLEAASNADLFIESIVEDLATKQAKFNEVDRIAPRDCILASNTSTLEIAAIQTATQRPDRVVGLHFFNPATVMKLVEVIPTSSTNASVTANVLGFVERIGKTAVLVKDSTGFVVNRLLTPYMCDAIRAFESGLAGVGGIDTAMQLGANHPMGPLALADYIGLDIVQAMAENLYERFGEEYMKPPALLERLVKDGRLGRKTRLGFYDYSSRPPTPNKAL